MCNLYGTAIVVPIMRTVTPFERDWFGLIKKLFIHERNCLYMRVNRIAGDMMVDN